MVRVLLSVLALSSILTTAQAGGFTPSGSATCTIASDGAVEFDVTLSGHVDGGSVYIEMMCDEQATLAATPTYTFSLSDSSCTSALAQDTTYSVVIREYIGMTYSSDLTFAVVCKYDMSTQVVTLDVSQAGATSLPTLTTEVATVIPSISMGITDGSDVAVTTANVGETVKLTVTLNENSMNIEVLSLTAETDSATISLITSGCSQYSSIISNPTSGTSVTLQFPMFIPWDDTTRSAAVDVTFTATVDFCATTCTAVTCVRRRRRDVSPSNNTSTEISTTIRVYPPGTNALGDTDAVVFDKVCIAKTPLTGAIIGMAFSLVICMGISAWMFCRMRRVVGRGSKAGFTNSSYLH